MKNVSFNILPGNIIPSNLYFTDTQINIETFAFIIIRNYIVLGFTIRFF